MPPNFEAFGYTCHIFQWPLQMRHFVTFLTEAENTMHL